MINITFALFLCLSLLKIKKIKKGKEDQKMLFG